MTWSLCYYELINWLNKLIYFEKNELIYILAKCKDCYINDYLENEENKDLMNLDANSF